ncbi:MAG TPA: hypothetical protein VN081_03885 [Dongiaceae bacterium]|nr:hypothetical protein [Dongiaceae bacterium]
MSGFKIVITPEHPEGIQVALTDAEVIQQQADAAYLPPPLPLEQITFAVKALPVGLRTDAAFGTFVSQCLLAIQNQDTESLGYLLNNAIAATPDASYKGFHTTQQEYIDLFNNAKALFGV